MKSINIYRKGCYDILMWWMEVFGTLLTALNVSFGFLNLLCAFALFNILNQIRKYKTKIKEKTTRLHNTSRSNINSIHNKYLKQFTQFNDSFISENNTMTDTISYIETRA
jgi:hypothetical protein